MRTMDELLSEDSAWPVMLKLFAESPHDVRVIEAAQSSRAAALLSSQATTRSMLGALVWNCGVVAVDHGWVRLLGAGFGALGGAHIEQLDDIEGNRLFDGVIVAYDVLGGRYAIHGGGLTEVPLGEVVYWAPDSLTWDSTGLSHSALVEFLLSDRLREFYADLRWSGWEADTEAVAPDQGLSAYSFAWSVEGRGPDVFREAVPMAEVIGAAEHAAREFRGRPDEKTFEIKFL